MSFKLEVISPKRRFFLGEAKQLILPSSKGQLTVLTKHMPLVCLLNAGEVKVRTEKESLKYQVKKGFFSIEKDSAILLIEDI